MNFLPFSSENKKPNKKQKNKNKIQNTKKKNTKNEKTPNSYARRKRAARLLKAFAAWMISGKKQGEAFKLPRKEPWISVSASEMKKFLGILILAGLQGRTSRVKEWWSKDPLKAFFPVQKIMTRDR